jgi:hypothetical protein
VKATIQSKVTLVWLVLTVLTALSWYLAEDYAVVHADALRGVTVALFVVAFFKVRLVVMHFMEIATAPLALRAVFETWCVLVCAVLVALYLGTPTA